MTITSEAVEAIVQHFEDEWGDTTYISDNEEDVPSIDTTWVRITVRHQVSAQKSLGEPGHRLYNRGGSVFLQIFNPVNDGTRNMNLIVDQARPIFEGVRLFSAGVDFTNGIFRELGIIDGWNAGIIEWPFNYDQRR